MSVADSILVPSLIVALTLTVVCAAMWAMTRSGRLGLNPLVGIRTRATMASPEAWRRGHLAAQPALVAAVRVGIVGLVLAGLARLVLPTSASVVAAVIGLLAALVPFGLLLYGTLLADRAARSGD
ncbi:SdpI family protein [Nocardioides sp.]|uniref:SdpI family protein n=1 Tax=Nocardioides sp. TaxID=35761 RepID=UPI00261B9AB5|nr:SdpI family protein [Nocardioides sp.]